MSGGYDLWHGTDHYITKNLGPLSVAVCIDIVGHTTISQFLITGGQMDIHRVLHQLSSECCAAILNVLEFCLHVLTMRQVLHDVHDLPIAQNSVLGTLFQDLGIRYIIPNTVFRY